MATTRTTAKVKQKRTPADPKALTEVQQRMLDAIVAYWAEHQHSPSIRDLMNACNLRSPSPVQNALDFLAAKGRIRRTEGVPRSIVVLQQSAE